MSTSDSGVATSFERFQRLSIDDPNPEVRREEYLRWIEEILELNYKEHCVVVLACNWVKARYMGPNPTFVRDKYGFIPVNISETTVQGLGPDCFAFPIHVQQVFYSKDSRGPDWRTATKVEVRGRRGDREYALEEEGGLFAVGHDSHFEGLSLQRGTERVRWKMDEDGDHVVVADIPPGIGNPEFESDESLLGDSSEEDI
jgi:hypothetical protein